MLLKKIISGALSLVVTASSFAAMPIVQANNENNEEYTAYVFAYFRRLVRDDERLCLGVSRDGYSFRALNNGEPVFQSSTEHTPGLQFPGSFRDPQIMRGEDGKFYIAVTDLAGTGSPNHQITIYPSDDLVNFETGIVVDYSKYPGFEDTNRAWAPQIIWCEDHENEDGTKGAYMIYLSIERYNSKPTYGTCMYKQFATDLYDLSTYTEPEYMLAGEPENGAADYPTGAIDGDIVYDKFNDRYIMYYDGQNVAVSDTIDGTYTFTGEQIFGGTAVEGSNIFKLNNEDKWIICADGGSFGTGFNMTETTDFANYNRLYKMSNSNPTGYDYDFTPRHGYVVPITENELDTLMTNYGYVDLPDRNDLDNPLKDMTIPYTESGYEITGNITLPKEYNGAEISWSSSDESIINTETKSFSEDEIAEYGENYSEIPAGIVNRPAEDTAVILTASAADGETKKFVVNVKAKPEKNYKEMSEDGDFKGYLYASFIEPAVTAKYQQVYFASSDDGRNWTELNNNKPVLESVLGEKATRDQYIMRSPEGDKFYLLATDLDVASDDWTHHGNEGSKNLMIWESDDLVNWSKQRSVKIADLTDETDTGCAWAPEATYDELTGEYIVYWSGKNLNDPEGKMVVYYSKTRDFYSFTPQKQFVYPIDSDGETPGEGELTTSRTFIDTTMIEGSDGLFYRTTKYESVSPLHVFIDVAKYPLGTFKRVKTNLDNRDFQGTEGPGWFKFNKDDAEANGAKFGLMLDGYRNPNLGVGFFPNSITDLNNTWESVEDNSADLEFTRIRDNYHMRAFAKHGGILPLTQEEYERVNTAYANVPPKGTDTKPSAVSSYDFETDSLDNIDAVFTSGASIEYDAEKDSKVLYLDGTSGSYMEFAAPKDSTGKVLEDYSVSFDIKNNTTGNYFNFYIGDGTSAGTGSNYFGVKIADNILLSSKNNANVQGKTGGVEYKTTFNVAGTQNNWKHCDITVEDGIAQLYIDNTWVGMLSMFSMDEIGASVIRFGFSAWSGDAASKAYYDNIRVYPVTLSGEGLKQEEMPNYFNDKNKVFDAQDYWVGVNDTSKLSSEAGWTSEKMPTFDGNIIHYIGIYPDYPVTMADGYGKDNDWFAMEFNLTSWANGDYAVKDIDGNVIFADCYSKDGYWVGHGERNYGGTVKDNYGVKRLPNYLKTVVTTESALTNTGKIDYGTDTLCTILVENQTGTVDEYEGDYYTVKVYKDMKLVSTEYHKGHINGVKTIDKFGGDRNCFGNLKFYTAKTEEPPKPATTIKINKCEIADGVLSIDTETNAENADVYTAVYYSDGRLANVFKNQLSVTMPTVENESYTVKAMVWDEDGMQPLCKEASAKAEREEDKKEAYLFVHFTGTDRKEDSEQIYFSVSEDGTKWRRLNSNEPVLRSTIGAKGVRDPHIIRSPKGDKFYMIATDLSIYNIDGNWGASQTAGSKSIVVWESEDLVNWSEPRLAEIGTDDAGCVWAPESVYDDESERYMVFWASKVASDNYGKQRIYRSYTKDFVTFTEPEVYIDYPKDSIDTTFVKEDGEYYRFTKNESQSSVIMEKGASLDGAFSEVSTYTLDGVAGNTVKGFEGPTAYKLNGSDKWCLLLDNYGGVGYKPFVTNDLSKGEFVSAPEFNLDSIYRHGTVIPITKAEYNALVEKYPIDPKESGDLVFSMGFDEKTTQPEIGKTEENGEISYTDGADGGKAAVLDGTDYIKLTEDKDGKNPLAGLESFTVSFKIKGNAKAWYLFAAPNDDAQTYRSEKYIGGIFNNSYLTCERYNSNAENRPVLAGSSLTANEWQDITIVYRPNMTVLYVNGKEASRMESVVGLKELLGDNPVIYIGKANWGSGEYSNGIIDDVKIYNYALSGM